MYSLQNLYIYTVSGACFETIRQNAAFRPANGLTVSVSDRDRPWTLIWRINKNISDALRCDR